MPAGSASHTCVFAVGHVAPFLHVAALDSTSVLRRRATLNSKVTDKNAKSMPLKLSPEEHVFAVCGPKQEAEPGLVTSAIKIFLRSA